MKRQSKIKRTSKLKAPTLARKVWVLCRQIAEKKYPKECYTCGAKNLSGQNCQLGHMIPKAALGAYLKFDLRLLRWQCSSCNIWRGGMGAEFIRNMIIREGQEYVDGIYRDRSVMVKAADHYEYLIAKYKQILEELLPHR